MLRKLVILSALAVLAAGPAMASDFTGDLALSGSVDYTASGNTLNFFAAQGPVAQGAQAVNAFGAQNGSAVGVSDFTFNGNITPVVLTTTRNGVETSLTLETLTSLVAVDGGWEIEASGVINQAGYDPTMATASFLLQSQYLGDNVNLMMFKGIAQATPSVAPEPRSIALLGTGLLGLAGLVRRRLLPKGARS